MVGDVSLTGHVRFMHRSLDFAFVVVSVWVSAYIRSHLHTFLPTQPLTDPATPTHKHTHAHTRHIDSPLLCSQHYNDNTLAPVQRLEEFRLPTILKEDTDMSND